MKKKLINLLALISAFVMLAGCAIKIGENDKNKGDNKKVDYDIILKRGGKYVLEEDGIVETKFSKDTTDKSWKQIYTINGEKENTTSWGNVARYVDTKATSEMTKKIIEALNTVKFKDFDDYIENGEKKILIFKEKDYIETELCGVVYYYTDIPQLEGFMMHNVTYPLASTQIPDENSCLIYTCRKGADPIERLFGGYQSVDFNYYPRLMRILSRYM